MRGGGFGTVSGNDDDNEYNDNDDNNNDDNVVLVVLSAMGTSPNQSQHINILTYSIPCTITLLNTFLTTPIQCAMFIHYLPLLYFCYIFRCHIHHHQGKRMWPLLKALCSYEATNFCFCSSYSWRNLKRCLTNRTADSNPETSNTSYMLYSLEVFGRTVNNKCLVSGTVLL